jgi:hypothetical protein
MLTIGKIWGGKMGLDRTFAQGFPQKCAGYRGKKSPAVWKSLKKSKKRY